MTHIDPFAPADSPLHPSQQGIRSVEDEAANLYQWRRDHFAMVTEADADVPEEVLEDRQVRYQYLLDEYGTPHEQVNNPFVAQPVLLRRSVWHDLEDVEIDRWKQLFEWHSVEDERDPAWVDRPLPTLDELEARARVFEASNDVSEFDSYPHRDASAPAPEAAADGDPEPPVSSAPPEVPKSTALKEEWVEYALAIERAKGDVSEEDAERIRKMTVADLKAAYRTKEA